MKVRNCQNVAVLTVTGSEGWLEIRNTDRRRRWITRILAADVTQEVWTSAPLTSLGFDA